MQVILDIAAIEQMRDEAQRIAQLLGQVETGGILMGYLYEDALHVLQSTGPGPNAKHEEKRCEMDLDYCLSEIARINLESEGKLVAVGYWHTHPDLYHGARPSPGDLEGIQVVTEAKTYLIPQPVSLIWWLPDFQNLDGSSTFTGWIYDVDTQQTKKVAVEVPNEWLIM